MIHVRASATALALSVVFVGSACTGDAPTPEAAIARAEAYVADGDYQKARVEFQSALQARPDDAETQVRYAKVLERLGRSREAASVYQQVVEKHPGHAAARAGLARAYLGAGAPERARDTATTGLETSPKNVELLTARAAARALLRDADGALKDAEEAYSLDPADEDAAAMLAGAYASRGRRDDAVKVLEATIEKLPKSIALRIALADIFFAANDSARAEPVVRALTSLQPAEASHWIRLAQVLASEGKLAEAEKSLADASRALPDSTQVHEALVRFIAQSRGQEAAVAELDRRIASRPDDVEPRLLLARLRAEAGDQGAAKEVLKSAIDSQGTKPGGLRARVQLAAMHAALGEISEAEALLKQVLDANPKDVDALALRGTILLARGDAVAAIGDLRGVLREQPEATAVMLVLARAHRALGESALAEEVLRRAMELAPTESAPVVALSDVLMESGRAPDAKAMLLRAARARPLDVEVQQSLFRASAATNDLETAAKAVDAVLALQPNAPATSMMAGLLAEARGNLRAAEERYAKVLSMQAADDALQGLVRVLVAQNRQGEALAVLDEQIKKAPGYALPQQLKATLLQRAGRSAEARVAYEEARRIAPKWSAPVRGLASLAVSGGDVAGGIRVLEGSVETLDDPLAVQVELAQLYERAGRHRDAIAAYEKIVATSPKLLPARNNLALLLVEKGKDPAAMKRADEIVAPLAESDSPVFLGTYGWVKFKRGDALAALPYLERAADGLPDQPSVRYRLAVAELAAARPEDARRNLTAALARNVPFPEADSARQQLAKLARNGSAPGTP